ncbi:MAG TPA: signal recognition particle-docking protein FtsY [Candidatus Binataceae bacterium]|nr:signal recognition particle-docking protein FtsY [Candidatus Binataceae bacterium]
MSSLDTILILLIGVGAGAALIFIQVLIQWSLRKRLPAPARAPELPSAPPPPESRAEVAVEPAAAPEAPPEPQVAPRQAAPRQAAPPAPPPTAPPPPPAPLRAPARIGVGLRKTRESFLARIRAAVTGSRKADEIYEALEEALIAADVGVEASMKISAAVRARLGNDSNPDTIRDALKAEIAAILANAERPAAEVPGETPLVILMVGVNGVGKTTTVAKLAARLKSARGNVIVAAGDTFRAAAIEQLQVWCDRVGVDVVKQAQGSDPAAVAFDAIKAAVARKAGAVIIDTAGRLQTKVNLMEELRKIGRVIGRELPGAPHETWLVLDANTGQNALSQAKLFGDAVPLTGVVLAKLDSTARGGVVVAIAERLRIPVRYVGLGEEVEDLREFDGREFVDALFESGEESGESAGGTYAA